MWHRAVKNGIINQSRSFTNTSKNYFICKATKLTCRGSRHRDCQSYPKCLQVLKDFLTILNFGAKLFAQFIKLELIGNPKFCFTLRLKEEVISCESAALMFHQKKYLKFFIDLFPILISILRAHLKTKKLRVVQVTDGLMIGS